MTNKIENKIIEFLDKTFIINSNYSGLTLLDNTYYVEFNCGGVLSVINKHFSVKLSFNDIIKPFNKWHKNTHKGK